MIIDYWLHSVLDFYPIIANIIRFLSSIVQRLGERVSQRPQLERDCFSSLVLRALKNSGLMVPICDSVPASSKRSLSFVATTTIPKAF